MKEYLDKISEFSTFLSARDHSLKEILDHLLRVVLVPIKSESIFFIQTNDFNEFLVTGSSGISKEAELELNSDFSLHDEYPVSYAIRQGKIVWIDGSEASHKKYPLLANFPLIVGDKTLICVPIFLTGTPVAAMSIFSEHGKEEDAEVKSFLSAVGHIFSMYFYRNVLSSPDEDDDIHVKNPAEKSKPGAGDLTLTERQLVILRLISEERTNQSISHFLGYSQSTIRQEIMRIFAKLGCNHRAEAAAIYKSYSEKVS